MNKLLCATITVLLLVAAPDARPEDGDSVRAEAATAPASGGLRLNELLASNRVGRLDDEGQTSDWIEIHNPGNAPVRLGGYRLTNEPEAPGKWAFPNNRIPADGCLLIWMSGLDRVSLAPEALRASAASIPFETTLIKHGANWRYLSSPGGRKKTDGWTVAEFDDSAFAVGPAGFGYGDEDDATELPFGTTAVLLRREFTLEEPLNSGALVLEVDFDDGFAAYLNGTRVAAVNAPAGEPNLDSVARDGREAGFVERFDLSAHAALLRQGKNVLAVAGLNTHRESSDLSIRVALGVLPAVCHANFRLRKEGGSLLLVAPDGSIADRIEYGRQLADQSLGRSATSPADWGYFLTPTPGAANAGPQQPSPVKARVSFSPEPGAIGKGEKIRITEKSSAAVDIRYTTDGSDPDGSSRLYREPIEVADTSLFRSAAFIGGERASPIVPATYLVGRRPELPVLSVSMKPDDFLEVHLQGNARGRGSERPAFLELFNPDGERVAATGFGFRLHGGAGRRGGLDIKKSYRAYFRGIYGERRLKHPVIPEAGVKKYDKLVLRSNFNDGRSHGSYIRDQVIRDLHRDMGALASAGSWYVLLINSASHGVFNVVERMDEEFFASHLGPGRFDVIKTGNTVLSGSRQGWEALRQFISTTDFSNPANYEELSRRVDIENFTSYVILNLWALNLDWPHNNWYAARRVPDGKWIFLCWDAEWGLVGGPYEPNANPYAFIDSGGAYGHGLQRKLFFALLGNAGYREYYQQEVRRHLGSALSPENALRQVRRHRDVIAADIGRDFAANGHNIDRWHEEIAEIERFVRRGAESFQRYTDEYFSRETSSAGDDRVAMIEGEAGHRHVIYRDEDGQLRELTVSPDGSRVSDSEITSLAKAPPAAGRPTACSLGPGERRVFYRGKAGHLHELSRVDGAWRHTNLTGQLGIPDASCDPSVAVFDGVPHVVYTDDTARLRELWRDGQWRHHPLPAAPRPAGGVIVSRSERALHVTYRTLYGAACEQTLFMDAVTADRRNWSPRLIHRLPARGQPIGFSAGGKRVIVFRAAERWPSREPFVFDWIERSRQPGYRRYSGPRDAFVQALDRGHRFRELEPLRATTGQIAGNPCAIHDARRNRDHFAYRDSAGQIREATRNGDDWQLTNPTALAGAPPAAGEPAGLVSAQAGSRYYVYRGRDGHLYELRFDDSWTHRNLSAAVKQNER
ncbi:MAG: CotH kinase family protein [Verrucomicrobia bacterium]|nr:CotH kinase family protein [Verrucomicrobiota bacterium]